MRSVLRAAQRLAGVSSLSGAVAGEVASACSTSGRHATSSMMHLHAAMLPGVVAACATGSCHPIRHVAKQSFPHGWRSFASGGAEVKGKQRASAAELGMYGAAAAIFMIGFAWSSVPLYKLFCAATGYGGTVAGAETVEEKLKRRAENPNPELEKAAEQRQVTVWFNADVADDMPWEFQPTQECVHVNPGKSTLVFFTAKNKSDKPVTGYSIYNVSPDKAAQYFNKIQCFCFEEQRLRAGEEIDMPVFFYLDPEMAADWNCRNVTNITLSYVFHKVDDADLEDVEDDGAPTVVKLHSGSHPPQATLPPNSKPAAVAAAPAAVAAAPAAAAAQAA